MSGRAFQRQDRAKACWQGQQEQRALVTAARRQQMQQMALSDEIKFVRCLRLARVVSLCQLPWWPAFSETYPYEAAQITLLARDSGIGSR